MTNDRSTTCVLFAAGSFLVAFSILFRASDSDRVAWSGLEPRPAAVQAASIEDEADTPARRSIPHGIYGAPVGQVMDYAYRVELHSAAEQQPGVSGTPTGADLICTGVLRVQVAARSRDAVVAHLALAELTARGSHADPVLRDLEALAARGCFVHYSRRGQVTGYSFPAELDGNGRGMLRGLFAPLGFAVEDGGEEAWTTTEADGIGVFDASYARLADDGVTLAISRRKDRYVTMGRPLPEVTQQDLEGVAIAALDRGVGWLRRVEAQERGSVAIPGSGTLRWSVHLTLDLLRVATGSPLDLGDLATVAAADGEEELEAALAERRRAIAASTIGSLTLDQALSAIRFAAAIPDDGAARVEAWHRLTLLLELDPGAVAQVEAAARDPGTTTAEANALFAALGAAGGDDAQRALAAAVGDAGLAGERRRLAVSAAMQLRAPRPEVFAAVETVIDGPGGADELVASSLLTYGALAGKVPASAAGPMQRLLAREARATTSHELCLWIEAVGNAGAAAAAGRDRILLHARSRDARVRLAAASALRNLGDDTARATLTQLCTSDTDPAVRVQAAASLAGHGSAARAVLEGVAARDPDGRVCAEARRILARLDAPGRRG